MHLCDTIAIQVVRRRQCLSRTLVKLEQYTAALVYNTYTRWWSMGGFNGYNYDIQVSHNSFHNNHRFTDRKLVPNQWETALLCNDVSLAGRKPRISPGLLQISCIMGILNPERWSWLYPCSLKMVGGIVVWPCLSICRLHGFWSITSVWFEISLSNFICTYPMPLSESPWIFMVKSQILWFLIYDSMIFFFFYTQILIKGRGYPSRSLIYNATHYLTRQVSWVSWTLMSTVPKRLLDLITHSLSWVSSGAVSCVNSGSKYQAWVNDTIWGQRLSWSAKTLYHNAGHTFLGTLFFLCWTKLKIVWYLTCDVETFLGHDSI